MKRIVFVLVLMLGFQFATAQESGYYYGKQVKDTVTYLFGDTVNVRQSPSTSAKTVDTLPIGTEIKIISDTTNEFKLNGYREVWYKIGYYNLKNVYKEGYIWGGLIAKAAVFFDSDKDGTKDELLLVGINQANSERLVGEARVSKKNKMIASATYDPIGSEGCTACGYSISVKPVDCGAFTPEILMFSIRFEFGACDISQGNVLMAYSGNNLIQAIRAVWAGNEIGSLRYQFVFPNQPGGSPNTIRVINKSSDFENDCVAFGFEEFEWTGKFFKRTANGNLDGFENFTPEE